MLSTTKRYLRSIRDFGLHLRIVGVAALPRLLRDLRYRKYLREPLSLHPFKSVWVGPDSHPDQVRWSPHVHPSSHRTAETLLAPVPCSIAYELEPTKSTWFRTFAKSARQSYDAQCYVRLYSTQGRLLKEETRLLCAKDVRHRHAGVEFCISLQEFAGQSVTLVLEASGGHPQELLMWVSPTLLTPSVRQSKSRSSHNSIRELAESRLAQILHRPDSAMEFPNYPAPSVSIIIPTYNNSAILLACLESILAHTSVAYELILVDDCSTDRTPELINRLKNVRSRRNESNLNFVKTCNRGSRLARAPYLLFLNDDTIVTPGWLEALIQPLEEDPNTGAVGAKLIYPDGRLQEAGSILWKNGSAHGYGRGQDPFDFEYNHLRVVDFCSGACLLVRATLFNQLGGFDQSFCPAYYEDVDLCLALQDLGYTVKYQPRCVVFHHEHMSNGSERAAQLCEKNRLKLLEKWKRVVGERYGPENVLLARERREGKRLLFIDDTLPASRLGCGLPRSLALLHLFTKMGFVMSFAPMSDPTTRQPECGQLQGLGVEVFCGLSSAEICDQLQARRGYYDFIFLSRPHNAKKHLSFLRKNFPETQVIYDAEALYYRREVAMKDRLGSPLSESKVEDLKNEEIRLMAQADAVITVTQAERDLLTQAQLKVPISVLPMVAHPRSSPSAEGRKDILFVGTLSKKRNFPNVEAITHFAESVFPQILRKIPECRLLIAGSEPDLSVLGLASADIEVLGFVEDLTQLYARARLFVAPLNFCAGLQLKVVEAMAYGLPCVLSEVAKADFTHENHALIASNDREFVDEILRLYSDDELWLRIQEGASNWVKLNCSEATAEGIIKDCLRVAP